MLQAVAGPSHRDGVRGIEARLYINCCRPTPSSSVSLYRRTLNNSDECIFSMDTLSLEITDMIVDLVALDRSSLRSFSAISKFFRRNLAPRIFRHLVLEDALKGDDSEEINDRLRGFVNFAKYSGWSPFVESIDIMINFPIFLLEPREPVASPSIWYPEIFVYVLSNISILFPALHTLKIGFPNTMEDCDDSFDFMLQEFPNIPEDSDHHLLLEHLHVVFDSIANNAFARGEALSSQPIKHLSISPYPPFGCDEIISPRIRTFLSNLASFSLTTCPEYVLEEGAYANQCLKEFESLVVQSNFLAQIQGTCLESMRLESLSTCPFGSGWETTEPLNIANSLSMHNTSLKKLVLTNIVLSYENCILDSGGLAALISADGSALEMLILRGAAWVVEAFDEQSLDHWGTFFKFIREHKSANLKEIGIFEISEEDLNPWMGYVEPTAERKFPYEWLDPSWGYMPIVFPGKEDGEDMPVFRREGDRKEWNLLQEAIGTSHGV